MLNKIKLLSLLSCAMLGLQACNDSDEQQTANAPKQVVNVNTLVYNAIRQDPLANMLFAATGAANVGDEPCDVKVFRMKYDTVGGAGEPTTSSGVFMLPHGSDARCSGSLPVVLYAHGTEDDSAFDMSQFIVDPTNTSALDSTVALAAYASQGYAVIAPNFAGYADSPLDYHPYIDEAQQGNEMMQALEHVREYANMLGANLSSELFVTGESSGGYAAMAAHKALEASGEAVTASTLISGPYAMLDYVDTIMAGYVPIGSTTYFPMIMTAMDKAHDVYDDPAEVYAEAYQAIAEEALPRVGGFDASGLPFTALFSGTPPKDANPLQQLGFGDDHLVADSFRTAWVSDMLTNGDEPANKVRQVIMGKDMRNWMPNAPVLLCGTGNDQTVYYFNTELMLEYWSDLVDAGLVSSLDLAATPAGPFAAVQGAFQGAGFEIFEEHSASAAFCALAGLNYFGAIRAQMAAQ